jgi:hypothetical protein
MMNFIKKNRIEFALLIALLLVTLFLRIYKIDAYMTFLGDEGRDALMIKRILTTGDIPLLGMTGYCTVSTIPITLLRK